MGGGGAHIPRFRLQSREGFRHPPAKQDQFGVIQHSTARREGEDGREGVVLSWSDQLTGLETHHELCLYFMEDVGSCLLSEHYIYVQISINLRNL